MDIHTIAPFGLLILAVGLWRLLVRRWRKDWPIVRATVEKRVPESSWGWFQGDLLYRGKKKETWAIYQYLDTPRECIISPEFTLSAGGALLWSSGMNKKDMELRVNPRRPNRAYPIDDGKEWPYWIGVGTVLFVVGALWPAS